MPGRFSWQREPWLRYMKGFSQDGYFLPLHHFLFVPFPNRMKQITKSPFLALLGWEGRGDFAPRTLPYVAFVEIYHI